jgi:outer membrane murein-binding lipoprotein Lpp
MFNGDVLRYLAGMDSKLNQIIARCISLQQKVDKLMALVDTLKADLKNLDDETTQVGVVLAALVAKRNDPSLSPAELTEVEAAFAALSDRLTSLGKDPANPVPPPTPALKKAKQLAAKP